jgi:hypothetical protein
MSNMIFDPKTGEIKGGGGGSGGFKTCSARKPFIRLLKILFLMVLLLFVFTTIKEKGVEDDFDKYIRFNEKSIEYVFGFVDSPENSLNEIVKCIYSPYCIYGLLFFIFAFLALINLIKTIYIWLS